MAPRTQHEPKVSHTVHHDRQATTHRPRPTEPVAAPAQPVAAEPAPAPVEALATTPARGSDFVLPPTIVSRGDLGKTIREIEAINDYFHQEGLRGRKDQPLPTLSLGLDSMAKVNGLNMIHAEDRERLHGFLNRIKSKSPTVHMSFPSEAGDDFKAKLLDWFRTNIHPHILLNIGLQPELAAGCTVRTSNKFFDFSFRARFEKSKTKLMTALEKLDDKAPPLADANATVDYSLQAQDADPGAAAPAGAVAATVATEPVAATTAQTPATTEAPTAGGTA